MKDIGYYNGRMDALEHMQVPMLDRGCYFGDGIYETVLMSHGTFHDIDRHIDRFYQGTADIFLTVPYTKQQLKELLLWVSSHSEYKEQFIYWQLTRGTALRSHAAKDLSPNLWITITKASLPDFEHTLKLISVEDRRSSYCHIKTLNLLPNILAASQAAQEGCEEAVFVRNGYVTECSHSNIHILKDGVLQTAPADCHILAGIGRFNLICACRNLQIPVLERAFSYEDLLHADEVLLTSTTKICQRADTIDGHHIGGKAISLVKKIQRLLTFSEIASENTPSIS